MEQHQQAVLALVRELPTAPHAPDPRAPALDLLDRHVLDVHRAERGKQADIDHVLVARSVDGLHSRSSAEKRRNSPAAWANVTRAASAASADVPSTVGRARPELHARYTSSSVSRSQSSANRLVK